MQAQDQLRQAAAAGAGLVMGCDGLAPERVGDFHLALQAALEAGVLDQVRNWRP